MTALRNVLALVQKEWRHYFGSPIAYVALTMWSLLFGAFYSIVFLQFLRVSARSGPMDMGGGPKMSLNEWVIEGLLHNMAVVALFVAPMLTMRLFAEEKRSGTMELLATAPITSLQIVLGKFLGAVSLYALMIVAGLVNFLLLWYYAPVDPEWKPVATGALALLLVGSCFIAVGLFISTLTRNQIVAGTLTFGVLLGFWILGWWKDETSGPLMKVVAYLGLLTHLDEMMKGVLDLKDVVFYLSFVALGIFLCHQSLESQRWRA
ncbi:MAG TPA: ABC transporter permease [Vicinamibacteria bacterium]|nr:ABC transporter permease [Vicinamibacteria bacterium]